MTHANGSTTCDFVYESYEIKTAGMSLKDFRVRWNIIGDIWQIQHSK